MLHLLFCLVSAGSSSTTGISGGLQQSLAQAAQHRAEAASMMKQRRVVRQNTAAARRVAQHAVSAGSAAMEQERSRNAQLLHAVDDHIPADMPLHPAADPWQTDGAKLQGMLVPPLHGLPSYTQMEDPMPAYMQAASDFRTCVDARLQLGTAVCCVCHATFRLSPRTRALHKRSSTKSTTALMKQHVQGQSEDH